MKNHSLLQPQENVITVQMNIMMIIIFLIRSNQFMFNFKVY